MVNSQISFHGEAGIFPGPDQTDTATPDTWQMLWHLEAPFPGDSLFCSLRFPLHYLSKYLFDLIVGLL